MHLFAGLRRGEEVYPWNTIITAVLGRRAVRNAMRPSAPMSANWIRLQTGSSVWNARSRSARFRVLGAGLSPIRGRNLHVEVTKNIFGGNS